MTTVAITILLILANVLGATMAYPQAVRLWRTGDVGGVSATWLGVSVSMNVWWLAYGLTNDLWGLVPVSGVAAILYLLMSISYLRVIGRRAISGLVLGALGFGMAPLPFLVVGGWVHAGLAIGLCYGMQLSPAVVTACRSSDLSGIAPTTWLMAWAEAALWVVYGSVTDDGALLIGGTSGVVLSSVILTRLSWTGHRPFQIGAVRTRPIWEAASPITK